MTDERFVFVQDVRDKKRTARGAYNKVRGGGKKVKMPSDYLTRKERNAMNSEVISYNLNSPMKWKEFKLMPDELQVEYINGLIQKYSATCVWISKMFGVSDATTRVWGKLHNFTWPHVCGHDAIKNKPRWEKFLNDKSPAEVNHAEEIPAEEPEKAEEPKPEPKKVDANANNIALLLSMLAGTGAKLTIEVTL